MFQSHQLAGWKMRQARDALQKTKGALLGIDGFLVQAADDAMDARELLASDQRLVREELSDLKANKDAQTRELRRKTLLEEQRRTVGLEGLRGLLEQRITEVEDELQVDETARRVVATKLAAEGERSELLRGHLGMLPDESLVGQSVSGEGGGLMTPSRRSVPTEYKPRTTENARVQSQWGSYLYKPDASVRTTTASRASIAPGGLIDAEAARKLCSDADGLLRDALPGNEGELRDSLIELRLEADKVEGEIGRIKEEIDDRRGRMLATMERHSDQLMDQLQLAQMLIEQKLQYLGRQSLLGTRAGAGGEILNEREDGGESGAINAQGILKRDGRGTTSRGTAGVGDSSSKPLTPEEMLARVEKNLELAEESDSISAQQLEELRVQLDQETASLDRIDRDILAAAAGRDLTAAELQQIREAQEMVCSARTVLDDRRKRLFAFQKNLSEHRTSVANLKRASTHAAAARNSAARQKSVQLRASSIERRSPEMRPRRSTPPPVESIDEHNVEFLESFGDVGGRARGATPPVEVTSGGWLCVARGYAGRVFGGLGGVFRGAAAATEGVVRESEGGASLFAPPRESSLAFSAEAASANTDAINRQDDEDPRMQLEARGSSLKQTPKQGWSFLPKNMNAWLPGVPLFGKNNILSSGSATQFPSIQSYSGSGDFSGGALPPRRTSASTRANLSQTLLVSGDYVNSADYRAGGSERTSRLSSSSSGTTGAPGNPYRDSAEILEEKDRATGHELNYFRKSTRFDTSMYDEDGRERRSYGSTIYGVEKTFSDDYRATRPVETVRYTSVGDFVEASVWRALHWAWVALKLYLLFVLVLHIGHRYAEKARARRNAIVAQERAANREKVFFGPEPPEKKSSPGHAEYAGGFRYPSTDVSAKRKDGSPSSPVFIEDDEARTEPTHFFGVDPNELVLILYPGGGRAALEDLGESVVEALNDAAPVSREDLTRALVPYIAEPVLEEGVVGVRGRDGQYGASAGKRKYTLLQNFPMLMKAKEYVRGLFTGVTSFFRWLFGLREPEAAADSPEELAFGSSAAARLWRAVYFLEAPPGRAGGLVPRTGTYDYAGVTAYGQKPVDASLVAEFGEVGAASTSLQPDEGRVTLVEGASEELRSQCLRSEHMCSTHERRFLWYVYPHPLVINFLHELFL